MKNKGKIALKINNKIINTDGITLNEDEIGLLKKVLFKGKVSLCTTCKTKVCLANKETLTGAIHEGISTPEETIITSCANNRKKIL